MPHPAVRGDGRSAVERDHLQPLCDPSRLIGYTLAIALLRMTMRRCRVRLLVLVMLLLLAGLAAAGDSFVPDRHFALENPAELDPAAAERAYAQVVDDMAARFATSGEPAAKAYRRWWRANRSPYLSARHGARYVNAYVNRPARAYATLRPGEAMPVGSIIAKDSVSVDTSGTVLPGALALMEKMPPGHDARARDWRYVLILPDGSIFADSSGTNPEGTDFCVTCHATRGTADHLFLMPSSVTRTPPPE